MPLPGTTGLYASGGDPGDVSPGSGTVSWSGMVTPPATGDYTFRTYSSGQVQLSVDNRVVIDHWRQGWLPNEDIAHVTLTANQPVPVKLTWQSDIAVNVIRLLWKPPVANRTTSLWSRVGDGVDYTFVYGPALDAVIAGYRRLTGAAADDAPLGVWLLAVPRALPDRAGDHRRARGLPQPRGADRQHRPGLAVLDRGQLGLAPVRSRAVPRPDRDGSRASTTRTTRA